MIRKIVFPALVLLLALMLSCVKETYNLDKLSNKAHISPVFAFPAASGDITIADIVKPNDTVRFDNDNFIRIIFKKDSVFEIKAEDYYDFSDMVSLNRGYVFGNVMISDFQSTMPVTLDAISQHFSPALRAQFLELDDGNPHDFPAFPSTDIGEHSFGLLAGFEDVLLASGKLEIGVRNNLTAPLSDVKIRLYNSSGHTPVGPEVTIPSIAPGTTQNQVIDIAGINLTNSLVAAILFSGSPGMQNVIIDMDHTVDFIVYGYNLEARSGRMIVPLQTIGSLDNTDTIDFDPGEDIELEQAKINTGTITYKAVSKTNLSTSVYFSFPTSSRSGSTVSETFSIPPNTTLNGGINLNNTEIGLDTDPDQPYNRLPVDYEIKISSDGNMVNYSNTDSIHLELNLPDPQVDFLKGYFGQRQEDLEKDTIKTDIENVMKKISGEFHISNPSIKVNYSNSFGIPIGITFSATGKKDTQLKDLDLEPFTIDYPVYPVRDITSSFIINKSNSKLPDIVSMPPEEIRFSGAGKMNPDGTGGGRNNYVYGNSRFVASLEVEVPMELWVNNLQFADTVDNFLKQDDQGDDDNPFKPENIEYFRLKLKVSNGFPLGASLKLMLYDSLNNLVLNTVNAPDVIKAAAVDASGKVTAPTESETMIDFDKTFFEASKEADKMIIMFTLVSSEGGTKDVKFYSDYLISFRATLIVKPNVIF